MSHRPPVINLTSLPRRDAVAHDGRGVVESARALQADDFDTGLDFVEYVEVPAGSSIGLHRHGDDEELYFILSGRGLMTIEGAEHRVGPGDLILNRRHWAHGLDNDSREPIQILVWQVRYSGGEG